MMMMDSMNCDYENSEDVIGYTGPARCNGNDSMAMSVSTGCSPFPRDEGINDGGTNFEQTFQHLEALGQLLACSKCKKLPKEKVWTLGCCLHKYCESCVEDLMGKPCVICHKKGYPKDAKPDLFSSSILSQIPSVYKTIVQLNGLSWDNPTKENEEVASNGNYEKEAEKQQAVDELPENVKIYVDDNPFEFNDEDDKILAECTPGNQGPKGQVSQEFPDVLEETPQNKTKGRLSHANLFRKRKSSAPARTLKFPSQESCDNGVTVKNAIPSPGKALSDEELFRSQPEEKAVGNLELPVLTPYTKKQTVPISPSDEESNATKKSRARNSGEQQPPALTPHKQEPEKASDEEATVENQPTLRQRKASSSSLNSSSTKTSRKSTRGQARKTESLKQEDGLETSSDIPKEISKGHKVQKNKTKKVAITKSGPVVATERKRRISSASSGHQSAKAINPPGSISKEKRNPKGETALHVACRGGQIEKVQALIEAGADVNAKDHAGYTPMHEVINAKKCSLLDKAIILRLLCAKGGEVNALGGLEEATPLHSAVLLGAETLVSILLESGASPNIRMDNGKLPKDVTDNQVIRQLLEEKMANYTSSSSPSDNVNLNSSTFLSTTSMVEEDPAVMRVMLQKALIFFNYDVEPDIIQATKEKLKLKVSSTLTSKVTHVVHQYTDKKQRSSSCIPLSMEYLYALANCMWQISSDWISSSLKKGACVVPTSYEILGYLGEEDNNEEDAVPAVSRKNRENGNPGLLDGFCFYLYTTCCFTSPHLKLNKKQLTDLIIGAGGNVTNREPNPQEVGNNILQAPQRFHTLNNTRGSDSNSNNEKFVVTTHIILYDEKAPPQSLYRLEHVKSLKSAWLIDSLANFRLEDPEKY